MSVKKDCVGKLRIEGKVFLKKYTFDNLRILSISTDMQYKE